MREKIFIGRINDDEIGCFYIEDNHKDICEHYILEGADFSGYYEDIKSAVENDNVESYLNKEELLEFLTNEEKFDYYIEKLTSEEGLKFKEKIMSEEHEAMKEEYNLSDEDIKEILDDYTLDYEDRAIINGICDNTYDLGKEYIESCYSIPDFLDNYIDYEEFGDDLCEESEFYHKLDGGRVIIYNV
jgi:hypothetical protein